MRKFIENKFAILFYGLQVLTNDKLNLLRKWLPSWADTSFFELTKLYIPIKYRNIQICEYNILTTGDKVDTEPEWLKINRLNYAVIHGYCYFHFSCKSACNCKFPHFWRYLAVIELYEIVEQVKLEFNTMSYLSTPFVLYMDTDIMFTNYSFKIEYIHQCISDSSLFFAVDDNCKSSLYPINVGVILASLNNYDTILFCYSVLTLQRNHFILNHTSHWGSSGLNDQPIVMQLLNDTGRINIKVINEYCSTQTSTSQNLFNINVPVEKPGVSVIPSRYLNSITRSEDWILYKDKEELRTIQGWDKNSWTCHFSGANSSTIPFLIWNICNELQTEQKFGFICPYNLNKILTIEYLELTEKDERRRLHILSYPNYLFLRESTKFVSSIENVKIMFLKLSFAYSDILIKYSKLLQFLSKNLPLNSLEKNFLGGSTKQILHNAYKLGELVFKIYSNAKANSDKLQDIIRIKEDYTGINYSCKSESFDKSKNLCYIGSPLYLILTTANLTNKDNETFPTMN